MACLLHAPTAPLKMPHCTPTQANRRLCRRSQASAGATAADRPPAALASPSAGVPLQPAADRSASSHPEFASWLSERGVDQSRITTQPVHRAGYVIDTTVAAMDLREGDVILRVPEDLVVTLNRCEFWPERVIRLWQEYGHTI